MIPAGSLLFLSRKDVQAELGLAACIEAVEAAFVQHARGRLPVAPGVLGAHLNGGGFHVKTAGAGSDPCYFAAKINGNFPRNPARHGLPTIQGLIALFDGERGIPLAVMDSIEITILRTAAASAVAARRLATDGAATVTICGCGSQGKSHLRALSLVRPIRRAFALDQNPDFARAFALELTAELGIDVLPADDLADAVAASDLCVTATTSREPIFFAAMLHPGLFVAAVGADNPEKQEIAPAAMGQSRVVVDLVGQAAGMGDLHHAIAAGVMTPADVHAELGQVLVGDRPGRTSDQETFIFDSTGTALQDVAAAALVYEAALRTGRGTALNLA
ncbi:MAG TPA: ornithine cyclodeaminase family protein [Gemmatimonadales bacterium]|nr:ornithine cyclodeaminase family protein [Gemmatimonadales bacterium]